MSTKTTLKRIALVTVAALSFGMVTSVTANAATYITGSGSQMYCSVSLEASSTGATTCTGSAGGQVTLNFEKYYSEVEDSVNGWSYARLAASTTMTITTTAAHGFAVGQKVTVYFGASDPAGLEGTFTIATVPSTTTFTYVSGANTAISGNAATDDYLRAYVPTFYLNTAATFVSLPTATATAPTWTNNVNGTGGVTWSPATANETLTMPLTYATAGDTSVVASYVSTTTGVSLTKSTAAISWLGASSLAASLQYSTLRRSATVATWPALTDAAPISVSRSLTSSAPTLRAVAHLTAKNANNQALYGQTATVSISGPGLASIASGTTEGAAVSGCTTPQGASVSDAALATDRK